MKTINLKDTIYDIVQTEARLQNVLVELGFTPMGDAITLNTVGRVMTLDKALAHRGIALSTLKAAFLEMGVSVDE